MLLIHLFLLVIFYRVSLFTFDKIATGLCRSSRAAPPPKTTSAIHLRTFVIKLHQSRALMYHRLNSESPHCANNTLLSQTCFLPLFNVQLPLVTIRKYFSKTKRLGEKSAVWLFVNRVRGCVIHCKTYKLNKR